jgi:hypothetical protein
LVGKIIKFKEKHPKLFKIIFLSLLIIFLIIISSSSAYAGNTKPLLDAGSKLSIDGTTVEINHVNVFIGYLDKVDVGLSGSELAKFKSILVDLKDGKVDGNWNITEVKEVIKATQDSLSKYLNNINNKDITGSNVDMLVNHFSNVGRKFVDFDYSELINNGIKNVDGKFINSSGEIISSHSSIGPNM